jgi:hypothetical protein
MQLTVTSDRDRVLVIPGNRTDCLQLKPDEARRVAELIEESAAECESWVNAGGSRTILMGERRGALVRSWDGRVNVRLASFTACESIPYDAARKLAGEIRAKATEAEYRVAILWQPAETLSC